MVQIGLGEVVLDVGGDLHAEFVIQVSRVAGRLKVDNWYGMVMVIDLGKAAGFLGGWRCLAVASYLTDGVQLCDYFDTSSEVGQKLTRKQLVREIIIKYYQIKDHCPES